MNLAVAAVLVLVVGVGLVGVWFAVDRIRHTVESKLGTADAELRRLGDSSAWRDRGTDEMRREISGFREALEHMRAREHERRAREDQGWAVLHRVAAVLSGSQTSGRAGENVLREALAHLPPAMVVTDFRVNGRVVEFGLILPDGRRLPIDSKWPADGELQALAGCDDPAERERLVRAVEKAVAERAKEVSGYRDPALTAPVGVAAVPDAAYAVLRRAHADAYRQGVIVIPYSMALPVVLFLYTIVSRFGSTGDIDACLSDLMRAVDSMEATLENKVAKASTMLANATEDLRGQMGKARTAISRAREPEPPQPRLGPADPDEVLAPDDPRLLGIPP